jgi:hypothetical protein
MADTIEATVTLTINHRSGPEVSDPRHVVAWLCADGAWMAGARNGFRFQVCPDHADPDDCDPATCHTDAGEYAADIVLADLDD